MVYDIGNIPICNISWVATATGLRTKFDDSISYRQMTNNMHNASPNRNLNGGIRSHGSLENLAKKNYANIICTIAWSALVKAVQFRNV